MTKKSQCLLSFSYLILYFEYTLRLPAFAKQVYVYVFLIQLSSFVYIALCFKVSFYLALVSLTLFFNIFFCV